MPATATSELLASLDTITFEAMEMLAVLDDAEGLPSNSDRREAKRRILEIRARAQELFEWLTEAKLEDARH
ncbi:MAG TPA: hypothetical protein VEK57_05585 [Thermoanaerobaculia bacterium]|nr:hypothetical protein [Thermoanaerobaculia bacterium]